MKAALDWLQKHHEDIVLGLADLVAVQSISTDGEHGTEIERTAAMTCDQMRDAGLLNVEMLKVGNSLHTPTANGSRRGRPSRRSSCTPTTTCSRSTTSSSGSRIRGS